jgi:hypothetical protein
MIEMLPEDMAKRPNRFFPNGPIPRAEFDAWLSKRGLVVPDDLKQALLQETHASAALVCVVLTNVLF